jgi:hypothetical protein
METTDQGLNSAEQAVQASLASKIGRNSRHTKKQMIICMIGLVGSRKSTVANELAKRIGATVISSDRIRIELRKFDPCYDRTRLIAESLARDVIAKDGNVILDSDFIDPAKRQSICSLARDLGVDIFFVCTYTEEIIGTLTTRHLRFEQPNEFYGQDNDGRDVRMKEFIRRLPHHYDWSDEGGGRWTIKQPPTDVTVIADIETASDEVLKESVEKAARKLLEA